ncbi:MAG: hypothetical protein CR971_02600 [candidate division SR1 bacterium]|nr:MAG: hypothetical protein CR971_02600 [candidate division SR1 bacterium]
MAGMYNVGREQAAKMLGVSTRTIDRYVKSGKISYKKVANKVLLSREEIQTMKQDFDALHQQVNTEVVSASTSSETKQADTSSRKIAVKSSVDLDEKLDKFYHIFNEKDKMIEDKNQIIFMLQRRIGELETKLQTMVALPDYTKEKQDALLEKRKLENKVAELTNTVKNERVKSLLFISIALVFILLAVFYVFKY